MDFRRSSESIKHIGTMRDDLKYLTAAGRARTMTERMAKMKRSVVPLISFLFFISAVSVSAVGPEGFDAVVEFGYTLKDLADPELSISLGDRFVVLNGAVASRQAFSGDPETYSAELELVSGEWIGMETVLIHRCILLLEGPSFFGTVPFGRTRVRGPNEVELNSDILVIARFEGYREWTDGSTVPVARALYLRPLY